MSPSELRSELLLAAELRAVLYSTYDKLLDTKQRLRTIGPKIIDIESAKEMVDGALDCIADVSASLDEAEHAAHTQLTKTMKTEAGE